jgi:hypothetical protein
MCRHFVPPIVQIGLHHRDLRIGLSRLNALYAGMTGRLHILILRRMVPGQWLARLEACSLPKTRSHSQVESRRHSARFALVLGVSRG